MLTDIAAIKARSFLAEASDSLLLAAHSPFDKNRRLDSAIADLRDAMGLLGFDVVEKLTAQESAALALARRIAEDRGDIVGTR